MASVVTYETLSASEHSAQLRKAVIASTVGTAIEWYDFSLRHGGGTGLRQALLPERGAAGRDACGVRNLFHRLCRTADRRGDLRPLRRSHWPQGDADRHAYVHGLGDLPHRFRADLRLDWHLGRDFPDRPADDPRHWRRRRMGWLGAAGDGMVAHAEPARADRVLAAIRRALWLAVVEFRDPGFQRLVGR